MKRQQGFTLSELISCVFLLGFLALVGFGIYAAIHFILKFW
jgi:prepilin-type N-terminal cleavage/methylation domain-containing protein